MPNFRNNRRFVGIIQIIFALHISRNQNNFPVFTGVSEGQNQGRCQTQEKLTCLIRKNAMFVHSLCVPHAQTIHIYSRKIKTPEKNQEK